MGRRDIGALNRPPGAKPEGCGASIEPGRRFGCQIGRRAGRSVGSRVGCRSARRHRWGRCNIGAPGRRAAALAPRLAVESKGCDISARPGCRAGRAGTAAYFGFVFYPSVDLGFASGPFGAVVPPSDGCTTNPSFLGFALRPSGKLGFGFRPFGKPGFVSCPFGAVFRLWMDERRTLDSSMDKTRTLSASMDELRTLDALDGRNANPGFADGRMPNPGCVNGRNPNPRCARWVKDEPRMRQRTKPEPGKRSMDEARTLAAPPVARRTPPRRWVEFGPMPSRRSALLCPLVPRHTAPAP